MKTKTLAWPSHRLIALASALSLIVALAGCGGGGSSDSGSRQNSNTGTTTSSVGAAGGTVTAQSTSGAVSVAIPAGALTQATQITVTTVATNALPAAAPLSKCVLAAATFGPSGTTFPAGSPAVLTLPLPSQRTPGSIVWLLMLDETTQQWGYAAQAVVSTDGLSATASVSHFSTYMLSTLPQGTATLSFANQDHPAFGFSTGQVYQNGFGAPAGDADFLFEPWYDNQSPAPAMMPMGTGSSLQDMGAVALTSVTAAPANPTAPGSTCSPNQGHTYAFKTAEGNYALIHCNSITITLLAQSYDCVFTFDWVYQPDGTVNF